MSTNRNIPSPPDMETSKYEPDLNKPKKPMPKPKPKKAEAYEMTEEIVTAKNGGYVKAADGCVKKGRTRGTMVKM
jgi:hypothetical protein